METVSQATIGTFMPRSIESLLDHGFVDRAMAEARNLVRGPGRDDWWMPVLSQSDGVPPSHRLRYSSQDHDRAAAGGGVFPSPPTFKLDQAGCRPIDADASLPC
jgi:hypothetical protein